MADTAGQLRDILTELGVFYLEREQVMRNVVLALLAREHVFLLGPVGSGKTALLEALTARIDGANFFAVQLHEQMGREEIFGQIDVPRFSNDGVWKRDVDGYLPTAHLAMIDELDKGGPAVVRPLLRVINERRFRNGKGAEMRLPLISVVASANEMLPPSEAAVWDRFLLRDEVAYLAEPANFVKLMNPEHDDWVDIIDTTVTLEELVEAQQAIQSIPVPEKVLEAMLAVRTALAGQGVQASDRRWRASVKVMQASAWLDGRPEVDVQDLAVLEHIVWQSLEQRPMVSEQVLAVGSQAQRNVARALLLIDSVADTLRARVGQSADELGEYLADASHHLRQAQGMLDEAAGEVSPSRLTQARRLWRETKIDMLVQCAGLKRAEAEESVADTTPLGDELASR